MTCNANGCEIIRLLKPMGLKPHDRSGIISRFEEILQDLKEMQVLGKVLACKREVCHTHTYFFFLHSSNEYPTPDDIDRIIYA
ncbi:hypothetical protein Lal_00018600 [Lupinus albus]|nr:hypothetical protein Lal_00018600 [Lupinus albus]